MGEVKKLRCKNCEKTFQAGKAKEKIHLVESKLDRHPVFTEIYRCRYCPSSRLTVVVPYE